MTAFPRAGAATGWPALGYESLPWEPGLPEEFGASRSLRMRHLGPYRAAVVPAIAGAPLNLSAELTAQVAEASAEIGRFDAQMGGEIAPFSSLLLRSESAASSRIENLTASARSIAEAEIGRTDRTNAAEVVANSRTMSAALGLADSIDADSILTMHRALMEGTDPDHAGRWRDQPVWVGGSYLGPHEAQFVPPRHESVPAAIDDLVGFVRRDDLPALAHAAIAHAQFETVHPFTDGNGRTGRALVHSMLRHKRLTRAVTVPVSAGLLTSTGAYFAALGSYREGDPEPIVREFADAAFLAIGNGRQLVTELREIRDRWMTMQLRKDAAGWQLVDLVLRRPVVNSTVVAEELGVEIGNVHRIVKPLLEAGILVPGSGARRNQVWRSDEVLDVLDHFAARAGRRRAGA